MSNDIDIPSNSEENHPKTEAESLKSGEISHLHESVFRGIQAVITTVGAESSAIPKDPRGFEIRLYDAQVDGNKLEQAIADGTLIKGQLAARLRHEPTHGLDRAHSLAISYNVEKQKFFVRVGGAVEESLRKAGKIPPLHEVRAEIETLEDSNILSLDYFDHAIHDSSFGRMKIISKKSPNSSGQVEVVGAEHLNPRLKAINEGNGDPKDILLQVGAADLGLINRYLENSDQMHIFGFSSSGRMSRFNSAVATIAAEMTGQPPKAAVSTQPQVVFINRNMTPNALTPQAIAEKT